MISRLYRRLCIFRVLTNLLPHDSPVKVSNAIIRSMLEYELPVLVKSGKSMDFFLFACASWTTELFTGLATTIVLIVTFRKLWEGVRRGSMFIYDYYKV